jgi:serine/threonine protein kinase
VNAPSHHWNKVKALFEACLDAAPQERARLLDAAPDQVRTEVEALLATDGFASPLENNAAVFASPLFAKEATQEEPTPASIGPYRVLRRLGRGGMGVVYLAEQSQPHREVAIKLVVGQHDPALLTRFRREADALARLPHTGVARVFDVGSDAGRPYLVMEYINGELLSRHATSLTRERRLELLARIADAVEHAHGRGVVHRDLKPSNILVDADGQPKVLDFGIALLNEVGAESLTATGTLLGTPAYMSPEQALGDRVIDARADVYALGVLGYELLTDRLPLPIAGLTPLQALRVVGEHTPPPLSRMDPSLRGDLETVFEKALAKDPSLRYASAGAFADELRRFLAREPIHAHRPGTLHGTDAVGRRVRKAVRAGATARVLQRAALQLGTTRLGAVSPPATRRKPAPQAETTGEVNGARP